jgi:1-acyl-sn-glycerol-3-phosphate acyltransferase
MSPKFLMRVIAALIRLVSWPFIRYEFRGGACARERDGWIISANHRSVFDFPHAVLALAHWGKYGRIMVANEFWDQPVYGWALNAIDAIPVFRQTDPTGAFSAAIDVLHDGGNVCIMPEGGLHWDPDNPLLLGRFKSGVSRMAVDAEAPILPIALVGGDRLWVKRSKLPKLRLFRRTVVLCRVADEPLWLSGDDHRANADKVREVQSALLGEATRDLQAIDPSYMPHVTP